MTYVEPKAYSEHCQTSTMERFAKKQKNKTKKISTWCNSKPKPEK